MAAVRGSVCMQIVLICSMPRQDATMIILAMLGTFYELTFAQGQSFLIAYFIGVAGPVKIMSRACV